MSDHFEGSAFVWERFRKNPALSILGLPLLLLDVVLLPVRLILNRNDHQTGPVKDFYEPLPHSRMDQQSRGQWQKTRLYDSESSLKPHHFRSDRALADDMRRYTKQQTRRKKREAESVLYPGWRRPHWRFVSGFEPRPQSRRTESGITSRPSSSHRDASRASRAGSAYTEQSQGRPSKHIQEQYQEESIMPSKSGECPYQQAYDQAWPAQPTADTYDGRSDTKQTRIDEGDGSFPLHASNYQPASVASAHSSSRRSRRPEPTQPTHVLSSRSSRTKKSRSACSAYGNDENVDNGDERSESSVPRDKFDKWFHGQEKYKERWAPPPSSLHSVKTFRPLNRDESVAPWDSATQGGAPREAPEEAQFRYKDTTAAELADRMPKTAFRRSGAPGTPESGSTRYLRPHDIKLTESQTPNARSRGPPRSRSMSTSNTADLPNTGDLTPRSRSTASRAQSYRTARGGSRLRETIADELLSDVVSESYCTTCEGPDVDSEHNASASSNTVLPAAMSSGSRYFDVPQESHAPQMQGSMSGMQAQDFGMPQAQQPSRYGGGATRGHSGSRPTRVGSSAGH